ncbi:MAG: flagellar basal body-associated FliL family protein [Lachnospiraceae bacterium]|nr:flagellar basal body-associated FliL family protein [Lachnospiraceae bacterium]
MKKNLISIIILTLLIINIVLSSITLFSVFGTNKKTAALVTDIAAAVNLDLGAAQEEEEIVTVSMADVVTYDIAEMTIPLKKAEDGKEHYALLSITLSMNSKDKDYEVYGDLTTRESLIKGEINDVVAQYTVDQARENSHVIEEQILERIQLLFDSKFVYDVTISGALYQ